MNSNIAPSNSFMAGVVARFKAEGELHVMPTAPDCSLPEVDGEVTAQTISLRIVARTIASRHAQLLATLAAK